MNYNNLWKNKFLGMNFKCNHPMKEIFIGKIFDGIHSKGVFDIDIFLLGGDELIIARSPKKGDYINLIIDNDLDVSYIFFSVDKEKSRRKLFMYADDCLDEIVETFCANSVK